MSSSTSRTGLSRSQVVAVIIATLAIFVVVDFGRKAADNLRVRAHAESLAKMVEVAKQENERLRAEKEFAQSPAFIEKKVREDLGMGRPEEKRGVFLTPLPSEIAPAPPSITTEVQFAEAPCWQQWWRLFFDQAPPGTVPAVASSGTR